MKRREILTLLAPILVTGSCKENEKFTLPTIVTGKVTYEDGSPVEGAKLIFYGTKRQGVSGTTMFSETVYTELSGSYRVLYIITKETDFAEITLDHGSFLHPNPGYGNEVYVFVNEKVYFESTYKIPYSNYGKTTTVDYQIHRV